MAQYRKKPVVVEAVQWTGDNAADLDDFTGHAFYALSDGDRVNADDPEHTGSLYVAANSTWLGVATGEWVMKDAAGCYPCKPDIFEASYEPVVAL